ncbi:hypothetical protein [Negadavirga shengliensis]|uniref:Uncharacterized protein n=1 Tax=Negadavirga shengliensis TaxID=1389218 RepID=A0ABV9SUR8_9BACT
MKHTSISLLSISILRIMLSCIFLVAGSSHLFNVEKTVHRIDKAKFKGIAHLFGDTNFWSSHPEQVCW